MTHNLTLKLWLCAALWLALIASSAANAQDNKTTYAPAVAAAATTEHARFLADNKVTDIRLEVFTLSDARLYDSGFKVGNLLDWRWQDQQGQALPDGAYRCVVTVNDLTGHSTQRQGILLVQNGVAGWQTHEQAEAVLRNSAAARVAEGIAYFATVTNPAELTAAVLGHDGKDARLMTGSGGLSVRTGNFLKGEEQEKLRLTEEGKLEVKGLISTGEGIVFPDGTVQKTAYVASGQRLKQIAEDGKPVKFLPNAPAVGGSGTPNRLMKWAANGVDATDSTVTDNGPGGGITVNGSVQSTFYNVSASGTYMAFWPAIAGSAMLLRSNSLSGNLWIGHLGNVGLNASEPGSRFATGGGATVGAGYYNTTAPTNGLLVEGNVGIGTITPRHRLSLGAGPFWTQAFWSGALELTNASAIAWRANNATNRFGIGQSNGGLYFFRTLSEPGTTTNPAVYDMVISDGGNVGIGTTTPINSKLHVVNRGTGNHAIYGENDTFDGVTGSSESGFGVRGTSQTGVGVYGINLATAASGNAGVYGGSNSSIGVKGETLSGKGVLATSTSGTGVHATSGSGAGVLASSNTGNGVTASSVSGTGVFASGPTAMYADGNARQALNNGGWVKAMAFVDRDLILRCYNSITNSSSGNCGFPGISHLFSNGEYSTTIDFGFSVADRFVLITPIFGSFMTRHDKIQAGIRTISGNSITVVSQDSFGSDTAPGSQVTLTPLKFMIVVF